MSDTEAEARQLYLLRHAKSSWADLALDDHDRPLAPRGRREARYLADHIQQTGITPELVLCSTSLRTRQTLMPLVPCLQGEVEILLERTLYRTDLDTLLERLRAVPESVPSLLLIGHNPELHELVLHLATPSEQLEQLRANLPTATLVTLHGTSSWRHLAESELELIDVVIARNLPG